jgi:hypothetical protein
MTEEYTVSKNDYQFLLFARDYCDQAKEMTEKANVIREQVKENTIEPDDDNETKIAKSMIIADACESFEDFNKRSELLDKKFRRISTAWSRGEDLIQVRLEQE